jgi:hypothetical protein
LFPKKSIQLIILKQTYLNKELCPVILYEIKSGVETLRLNYIIRKEMRVSSDNVMETIFGTKKSEVT